MTSIRFVQAWSVHLAKAHAKTLLVHCFPITTGCRDNRGEVHARFSYARMYLFILLDGSRLSSAKDGLRGESLYSHMAPRITPNVMHNMHLSKITSMETEVAINAAGRHPTISRMGMTDNMLTYWSLESSTRMVLTCFHMFLTSLPFSRLQVLPIGEFRSRSVWRTPGTRCSPKYWIAYPWV